MDSANEAKMDGSKTMVLLKCKCKPEAYGEARALVWRPNTLYAPP